MASSFSRRVSSTSFRRFSGLSLAAAAGVALLFTGCKQAITDPKDPHFIVAEKGDWKITRADLDKEVATFLQGKNMTAAQVGPADMLRVDDMALKSMAVKKLLLDKAAKLPADQTKDLAKQEADELEQLKQGGTDQAFQAELDKNHITLDQLKKSIHEAMLVSLVMKNEVKYVPPTQQEVDGIYMANKDKFVNKAQVRVSRILIQVDPKATPAEKAAKKKIIDAARARVMKGEDLGKIANELSDDQYSKRNNGDMGWTPKGENEPGFDDVAFTSKVGVVSPVFETPLGFEFLKVTDSHPEGPVPLADARAYILSKLEPDAHRRQEDAYAHKVLDEGGITFHLVTPVTSATNGTSATPPPAAAAAPAEAPAPAPEAPAVSPH